jgi:uncharacterized heparinase superfamily protein
MKKVLEKVRRGLGKSPRYIMTRVALEARAEAEKILGPRRARHFEIKELLDETGAKDLEHLWLFLKACPYPAQTERVSPEDYERICPGDIRRILQKAEDALAHRVDLLGSGPVELGATIDWHKDYKTNLSWPVLYCRSIDYNNQDRPSDVKFPWEVSRMQWLIPAGQAYLLSGDEKYARAVRRVIEQWIRGNPYAQGVNWACTMEVALRILIWTWFFHVFAQSQEWDDPSFQLEFLRSLYLHSSFTALHLERSDVNGNHYTANAAGLVFAGLFFADGKRSRRWAEMGWKILTDELPKQVYEDGVDYEASVAYHRLVLELFLLPALYRRCAGKEIPEFYAQRISRMAVFTAAYSRPDGSVPLWGDGDDARALPFGGQGINDHRYLLGLVGCAIAPMQKAYFSGPREEIFWVLGAQAAESLADLQRPAQQLESGAFPHGGFYVMRGEQDHVFIDCGPVGLAGRGGHGHNDLLSFEAVLDGVHLITDCGSYVYTANYKERNRFRSTASHNTPMINGEEINRFPAGDALWTLCNDALPAVIKWETSPLRSVMEMSHSGYERLNPPVFLWRGISLDHVRHALVVSDEIRCSVGCQVIIPFHFSPKTDITIRENGGELNRPDGRFRVKWSGTGTWVAEKVAYRVSPSYGVAVPATKLVFRSVDNEAANISLNVEIFKEA